MIRRTADGGGEILSNVVLSQLKDHAPYGGVVPEIAARAHISHLDRLVAQAMAEAGVAYEALDGVAATAGPGLLGGVIVGLTMAKGIALAHEKPLLAVNHLEGHALTARLLQKVEFPYLLLLISGGHTQFQVVEAVGRYHRLGTTIDDALGEAFDKVAKLLGLGYPGGPAIQKTAVAGAADALTLPRAWLPGTYNFSFSGLKTAVLRLTRDYGAAGGEIPVADVARAFQDAVVDVLVTKTVEAAVAYGAREVLLAGGVAANVALREAIAAQSPVPVRYPAVWLCTDNAAMIGAAGYFAWQDGRRSGWDLDVVPSLPLVSA